MSVAKLFLGMGSLPVLFFELYEEMDPFEMIEENRFTYDTQVSWRFRDSVELFNASL